MTENVEILLPEHLKKIQAEQSAARQRDREIMTRLESVTARIGKLAPASV
ncbi:MAG: hypothetical protein QM681_12270 [Novosphingobium sp.]